MSKLTWKIAGYEVEEDDDEEEAEVAVEGKKSYICPYCQKSFSNGKAYGGHKRSHFINYNNNNNYNNGHVREGKIQISKYSKNHQEAIDDGQDYLVPHVHHDKSFLICGKKLSSKIKSLNGNMKIHNSEKAWSSPIGAKPRLALVEGGNSSSSTVSVDVTGNHHQQTDTSEAEKGFDFDVSNTFLGWARTGKRGKKDNKGPMQSVSHDAANHLLALANGEPHQDHASLPPKKRKSSFTSAINGDVKSSSPEKLKSIASCYSKSMNPPHEASEYDKSKGKGKGKAKAFMVSSDDDDDDDDNDYTTIASLKHVCSICNRSFRSYQAMGGHKAHHGRFYGDDNSSLAAVYGDERPPKPPRFRCNFCSKTFPKGQALGGHKRHCKETPGRALYFDLNKLPPAKNGTQKKAGKVAMETQEITLSLPWHEDGAEQDTLSSSNTS